MGVGDLSEVLLRLAADSAALVFAITRPRVARHESPIRTDLVGAMVVLNVCLHFVTVAVTRTDFGLGAGFGLFALLSIVRLRSSTFSTLGIANTFAVLSIAVVTGVDGITSTLALGGSGLISAVVVVVTMFTASRQLARFDVILDAVVTSPDQLDSNLALLGLEPVEARVIEVDAVRQLTRVRVAVPN